MGPSEGGRGDIKMQSLSRVGAAGAPHAQVGGLYSEAASGLRDLGAEVRDGEVESDVA